MLLQISAKGCR